MNFQISKSLLLLALVFCSTAIYGQTKLEKKIKNTQGDIQNLFKKKKNQSPDTSANNTAGNTGNKTEQTSLPVKEKPLNGEWVEVMPPSKNFNSIKMPAYKGKVKVGAGTLEYYKISPEFGAKATYYTDLLQMREGDSIFKDLDTKRITTNVKPPHGEDRNKPEIIKRKNSERAQYHLRHLGSQLLTDELYAKYFCVTGKCSEQKRPGVSLWGGINHTVSEFDRTDAYLSFIKDNNHTYLQEWWTKMDREAYIVSEFMLGDYDFDKEGFRIELNSESHMFRFSPANGTSLAYTNEKNKNKAHRVDTILRMGTQEAKELRKRQSQGEGRGKIYLVYNIVYYDKPKDRVSPGYTGTGIYFYLKTPRVEIFEDWALTKKIGEINFP